MVFQSLPFELSHCSRNQSIIAIRKASMKKAKLRFFKRAKPPESLSPPTNPHGSCQRRMASIYHLIKDKEQDVLRGAHVALSSRPATKPGLVKRGPG
jgi:hypothetical protein